MFGWSLTSFPGNSQIYLTAVEKNWLRDKSGSGLGTRLSGHVLMGSITWRNGGVIAGK